jgi:hypothetical protein
MAVQYLKAAVLSDPQNWQAFQTLGNCLQKQNKSQEALEAYDQSLALHPNNPALKSFADELRKQPIAVAAPPLPKIDGAAPGVSGRPVIGNSAGEGDLYAGALLEAQTRIRAGGSNPQDHPLLTNYYAGKILEEKSREGLKLGGQNQTVEEQFIGRYGAPKSDFYEPHVTFDFGILTPTVINFDLGFFLDPTKNLGLAFAYIPLPLSYSSYSGSYYNVPRDLIYLEPRIKFYSAPSGLTTYHGFSFVYFGLHQGVEPGGYQGTNFDILGMGYMFGFRTLPMDGMTMELGWKTGVAAIFLTEYQSVYSSYTYPYSYTYVPMQRVIPFPYFIPEFRFGFTF